MPAPIPPDPDPADPGAVSDAVDQLEERVLGGRVDPPRSDDTADQEDEAGGQDDSADSGAGSEPSS